MKIALDVSAFGCLPRRGVVARRCFDLKFIFVLQNQSSESQFRRSSSEIRFSIKSLKNGRQEDVLEMSKVSLVL